MDRRVEVARRSLSSAFVGAILLASLLTPAIAPASDVKDADIAQKIAAASSPEDHQEIADYYRQQAAGAAEKAKGHEAMLESYKRAGGRVYANMKQHCRSLIGSYKEEQKQYEALADLHAKQAAKPK
jgi:hypothetical protein